jgi:hypothetical protein
MASSAKTSLGSEAPKYVEKASAGYRTDIGLYISSVEGKVSKNEYCLVPRLPCGEQGAHVRSRKKMV